VIEIARIEMEVTLQCNPVELFLGLGLVHLLHLLLAFLISITRVIVVMPFPITKTEPAEFI